MAHIVTVDCEYLVPRVAAAYLRIEGPEVAIIETNTAHAAPRILAALHAEGLDESAVRYVIVTHVHLDHAGGASAIMRACPNATLLAHPRAARHLIDPTKLVASAKAVYGAERFAELYGTIEPVDASRVRSLEDGSEVTMGAARFRFLHTRGHANHHFVVHDPGLESVFTGDTFGLVYPHLQRGARFAFPSTSPTDFDAEQATASVERVLSLAPRRAYLTHFGAVEDLETVASQLRRWLDISGGLVRRARELSEDAREGWIRGELERETERAATEVGLTLDASDRALLELDLGLNAQGLAFAAGKD